MATRDRYAPGAFCMVDLTAHDMEAAVDFYDQLFGWEVAVQPLDTRHSYGIFTLEGEGVAGLAEASDEARTLGVPTAWNTYVNVEDAEATVRRAERFGASVQYPVRDLFDASRVAILKDPEGATFGIWQAREHAGARRIREPGTFCWNERFTRDRERLKGFYGELFGWHFQPLDVDGGSYDVIRVGEHNIGGIVEPEEFPESMPPSWVVYFDTDDIRRDAARVSELGGEVLMPVRETPVGPMTVARDSQGALFSLIQLQRPS